MTESCFVIEVHRDNFVSEVLERSAHTPVLADFWAPWCGPCQSLMPLLRALAEEYQGQFILAKINTDEEEALAREQNIRTIPTLKAFKLGEVVEEVRGALPESRLRALINGFVDQEYDKLRRQAVQAAAEHDQQRAQRLLKQALLLAPDNPETNAEFAELLLRQGQVEEAEELLRQLPLPAREQLRVKGILTKLHFVRISREHNDDHPLDQLHRQAAQDLLDNNYTAALEQLLTILSKQRDYRNGIAHQEMIQIFDLLGSQNPLVPRYRAKLFNLLH